MPFEIVRNDITKMAVDAIVNTANPRPVIGSGTDSRIHEIAGPELLNARQIIGSIDVGHAAITPAFQLNASYVIHTVTPDGGMAAYALHGYNEEEKYLVYALSRDGGKTWYENGNTHCRVGNPQIGILDGQYILHGRAGGRGFILYTSADGIHWDEGHMLESLSYGCFYSNNVLLHPVEPGQKDRLLVQFSQSYCDRGNKDSRVNVMHMMIESC